MAALERMVDGVRRVLARHETRSTASGLSYCLADSVSQLRAEHWDALGAGASFFMSRAYRELLEQHSPEGMQHRYALAYEGARPIAAVAAQILDVRGNQIANLKDSRLRRKALAQLSERMLVCGSLVSSGFHGVAFADDVDPALGWHAVAEALYRIRRADRLNGQIDYVMIKDLDAAASASAQALRTFSYRPMKTAPEMAMPIRENWTRYQDYLADLTSRYRGKAKKLLRDVEDAGYRVEHGADAAAHDAELHALYCQVESQAATRLSTLPRGYFSALATLAGPQRFRCTLIRNDERIVGFMTTLKDGERALAYYVGFDYAVNASVPIYLRLLHALIDDAISLGCRELSLGRTAMEPKAGLGATAHESSVWLRHRVPALNWMLRKLFTRVEAEAAPERTPFKDGETKGKR